MARFVFKLDDNGVRRIELDAAHGEELPVEMVLAYATMQQGWALDGIAERIAGLDNAVAGIARALKN